MTVVSNDPSWWPQIIFGVFYSYWLGKFNEFATEATLVSHDYAVFAYTLYWDTIFCVCFGGQHIDAYQRFGNYDIGLNDRCSEQYHELCKMCHNCGRACHVGCHNDCSVTCHVSEI
ncbi:hypothetical protein BD769DRAFT_1498125 [Suillus cothurnatus]|nr:hypothetical protein BD769DRAFT_1498125 [Suillus cothurnatus]